MKKDAGNQKQKSASVVEMDAGKFLHRINVGAQSQIAVFEDHVRKMGKEVNAEWKLVSLDRDSLIFEDQNNQYYTAQIKRLEGGRVRIEGIAKVKIVENKKSELFQKNLTSLIDCIAEDDMKGADVAFNRIAAQKFRSSVIPESGIVTTKDGVIRKVVIDSQIANEDIKPKIVSAITEACKNNVKVSRGRVVEAVFGEDKVKFPVSELTRRRVVARSMKNVAENAYKSEGFQARVKHIAALVSEDKIEEAIDVAANFLMESQEFSLLNQSEIKTLVENALAAQCCFNVMLAEDVGTLIFRTNCRVNHDDIIKEWRLTARQTEYAPLVENVRRLEESSNFEADYQKFLKSVFTEDISTKMAKASMYLNALRDMKRILKGDEANESLVESLDEYINRLQNAGNEVDDATVVEVEELVASTSESLLEDLDSLSDFDEIPQPLGDEDDTFGGKDAGAEPGQANMGMGGGLGGGGLGGLGGGPDLPLDLGGDDLGAGAAGLDGAAPGAGAPGAKSPKPAGADLGTDELNADDLGIDEEPILPESRVGRKAVSEEVEMCDKCKKASNKCECVEECGEDCVREQVEKLNNRGLAKELKAWVNSADKAFVEEGSERSMMILSILAEHANKLGESKIADGFRKIMLENTPVDTSNVSEDPYQYKVDVQINKNYKLSEDHETWPKKMKQTKESGEIGGKDTDREDDAAMGETGNDGADNVAPGGHKAAQLKKGSATAESITCGECNGQFDIVECMTEKGACCPECGNDVHTQLMEALDIQENLKGCGHKMARDTDAGGEGKGVQKQGLGCTDNCGGGSKQSMEKLGGKGVAKKNAADDDGTGSGGKKFGMEKLGGTGIAEEGEGETSQRKPWEKGEKAEKCEKCDCDPCECDGPEEDQFKWGTKRRGPLNFPTKGRGTIGKTEGGRTKSESTSKSEGEVVNEDTTIIVTDKPVDDIVARIVSATNDDGMIDEVGADDLDGDDLGGEAGLEAGLESEPMPGDEIAEPMPGIGDEGPGVDDIANAAASIPDEMGDGGVASADEMAPMDTGLSPEGEAEPHFGGETGEEHAEHEAGETPEQEQAEHAGGESEAGEDEDAGSEELKFEAPKNTPPAKPSKDKKESDKKESGEKSEKKSEKKGEKKEVDEDNDVTSPSHKDYASKDAAEKDGDGKKMRETPKFSTKDYDGGSKEAKTARPSGGK